MRYKNLTIVHNGEVYNFSSIKIELLSLGYSFSSNTDTEVILKAFHAWGVDCVEKLEGCSYSPYMKWIPINYTS